MSWLFLSTSCCLWKSVVRRTLDLRRNQNAELGTNKLALFFQIALIGVGVISESVPIVISESVPIVKLVLLTIPFFYAFLVSCV